MAYSTSTPPASAYSADSPIVVVGNAADYDGGSHSGRWAATRSMGAASMNLAGYDVERAYDRLWHNFTQPNADAVTSYLNLYTDPTQAIDYVILLGHNLADAPSGVAWEIVTADDDAFTSNVVVMGSENSGITSKRRVLKLASRYSNVNRVSIKLSASTDWRPRVGEVILGARSQAKFPPREPYDDRGSQSRIVRAVSPAGVTTEVVLFKGQRIARLDFVVSGSTERDLFRSIYESSQHGERGVVLVDHPSADGGKAYVMNLPEGFQVPIVNSPHEYQASLELIERGPFYLVE